MVFMSGHSPSVLVKNIAEIRELAAIELGRGSQSIKFLSRVLKGYLMSLLQC